MRRVFVSFFIQSLLLMTLVSVSSYAWAQVIVPSDSMSLPGDTVKNAANNVPKTKRDSIQTIKLAELEQQSDLKNTIQYKAIDYMELNMETKTLYLHKGGTLTYDKMVLAADSVAVDWEKNTMYADGLMDSTGQKSGRPGFTENEQTYAASRMSYNFKSQKGLVTMARTQQGTEYIIGEQVRKENDSTYYIKNGKFTSCELEHPHYYIKSSKLKVIPQQKIITGPLMLVIEDFPLPLILPFGFFPNQTGQRSGLVMPTYGESAERGFFLRNGGYYFAISDHADLLLRGDIFSKGGYRLEVGSAYNKRYHYDGSVQLEYGVQRFGEKDDPEGYFRKESNFWVHWKHNQTINPQATLTANVNAGSSNYFKNNTYNEQEYLTNTLKSTINFTQSFANSPWRLNLNIDQSQNTRTRLIALDLPSITMNRTRFFPFKGKNATGSKWYHTIGMNYTMSLKNQISVIDSLLPKILTAPTAILMVPEITNGDTNMVVRQGLDYFNNGIRHTVPISTQINVLNFINVQPSVTYNEFWYYRTKVYAFDTTSKKLYDNDVYGFAAARDFNAALSASTRIYGKFGGGGKRGSVYRHTLQPSIGYTFKPDFSKASWGYYQEVQIDSTGKLGRRDRFAGGIQGSPSAIEQQEINFGINNVLEMKYRTKVADGDTAATDPYTRITLLDAFAINGRYNFGADSLKMSPLSMTARTNFLNNKFTFQLNGAFDPYAVNGKGQRIDMFRFERNGNIGRMSSIGVTVNTVLSSKQGSGAALSSKTATAQELRDLKLYRDLYVDFDLPWKLNLFATLNYSNNGLRKDTTLTINASGDFNLSPKWKIGYTTGYDFAAMDFSYTSMSIYRDLHCWEMAMTWVPFGNRKSYNFTINVKSATLKDLKLTKRRDWQDRF
jgi:LptD protein